MDEISSVFGLIGSKGSEYSVTIVNSWLNKDVRSRVLSMGLEGEGMLL